MPEETYRFNDASYDRLNAAGISWRHVLHVLNNPARVRRHIGSVLHIAGLTPDETPIVVALIEEDDDQYLIVGARALDEDEAAAFRIMRKGGPS